LSRAPACVDTEWLLPILGLRPRAGGGVPGLSYGPYSLLSLSGRAPRALKNSGESAQVPRGREQAVCGERPTCVSAMEPIRAVGSVRKRRTSDLDRETPDDRTVDNFGVC
jgi:hypothetical protein